MRQGAVYMNGKLAGILTEISPTEYVFKYDDTYYADDMQPAVSLTLPKTQQEYRSAYLFPFFSNMLSEGRNRIVQSACCISMKTTISAFCWQQRKRMLPEQ